MNKQIIKNIIVNGVSFFCNVIIAILLTPYLVKQLGVIAYGFIPLAMVFTTYIGIITDSFTISVNRVLVKELQHENKNNANVIFNTSLVTILILILVLFVGLLPFLYFLEDVIFIPSNILCSVKLLFLILIVNFLFSLITSVFSISMYSSNRLDLMQINAIVRNLSRVLLVYILFYLYGSELYYVGIATLLSGFVSFIYAIFYFKKLTPQLKVDIRLFDREKISSITNLGGWLLLNQLGFVLFMKVDLLLINKMIGPESAGLYSIAIQFSDLLRTFAGIISGVLGPVILILYSQNKLNDMINITKGFSKFLSLTISIPIILICFFSKEILLQWLGYDYVGLSGLVWILTLPLIINISVLPLFSIQVAMGKVKVPGVLNLALGIMSVVLSIILIINTNLGYYAVAYSSAIMLTIKNAIFIPLYTSSILNVSKYKFIGIHIKTLFFTALSVFILYFLRDYLSVGDLSELLIVLTLMGVLLLFLSITFYKKQELENFKKFMRNKNEH